LEPAVLPGEEAQYFEGIRVGQLRGKMVHKWRHREGTLEEEDKEFGGRRNPYHNLEDVR
jgi:hypothetical protein